MKSGNLQYSTKDLTEGKEYTFRVSAENENGEGTPSEITTVAKDDVGKCQASHLVQNTLPEPYSLDNIF